MDNHLKLVGLGNILAGGLGVLGGLAVAFGMSFAGVASGDLAGGLLLGGLGLVGGLLATVMALPYLIGGIGLLAKRNWARYVLGVTSAISLFAFPIGTLLGGYSIWVLFHDDTKRLTAG
jgi:hypothetical protein